MARLAALRLDGDERLGVARDLQRIIALVDEMQAVDTQGVEPLAHPLDATQRLRADEATERVDRERCQAGAPEARDGLYLVPSVLSE
ncbi:MAG: Asp-tRNA(Asn)/Glu-tRNA(Gln) amidotransferase subunit GatC [Gammaproteobacteria bacterium]|nr:Asp-tRNA(Asn)/Glu-tRNA(Gln) amidotransferase subunit GatC [Gammaproteobacteria bacterium]MCY4342830.1 Asp-tRNA(Asn)/Glu-tRNA(Gln) amidotransferase subunit GatC [Gammaproteobacteria bacterium]